MQNKVTQETMSVSLLEYLVKTKPELKIKRGVKTDETAADKFRLHLLQI